VVKWEGTCRGAYVKAEVFVWCPLPEKIERHLREKGLIQTEHYSYTGSAGQHTKIVCPTEL
jgi:hypothetical protein